MRFGVNLMPVRSALRISFTPSGPSSERAFQRVARNLGFTRHFKTALYFRHWKSPYRELEREAARVLRGCRAGSVEPADRRPLAADILRRPRINVVEQKRGWKLIEWLSTRMEKGWRPDWLFLRQEKRARLEGVDWTLDCDGYWEPPERKGLEIYFGLSSRKAMAHPTWQRLEQTRFFERFGRELGKFGLRPGLRPRLGGEDFNGTSGGCYYATLERTVRDVDRVRDEILPLLKWSPV